MVLWRKISCEGCQVDGSSVAHRGLGLGRPGATIFLVIKSFPRYPIPPMRTIKWSYVVGAYLSLLGAGLLEVSRGPAYAELLRRYQIEEEIGFLFFFSASMAGMVTNLLSGYWLPRMGLAWATRVALILESVAFAGMGLVWDRGGSYPLFVLFATLFGVSLGAIGSLCNLLIYEGVPVEQSRRYFSGLHASYGVAALMAPLVTLALEGWGWSWPGIFLLLAIVPLPILAQTSLWPRELSAARGNHKLRSVFRDGTAWFLALACALYVASEVLVGTRLVVYTVKVVGLKESHGSMLLSLFFATLLLGRLIFTLVSLQISNLSILLGSAFFSLIFLSLGILWDPLILGLAGIPMSVFFPAVVALIGEWFPQRETAMMPFLMAMVGGVVVSSHWLVGRISAQVGLGGAFWLVPSSVLFALLILVGIAMNRGEWGSLRLTREGRG